MAPKSRKRKETAPKGDPPVWSKNKRLSSIDDRKWESILYREKIDPIDNPLVCEKPVVLEDFKGFGLVEKFEYLGWEAGLTYCYEEKEEIYLEEIKQWISTLERIPGSNPPFTTSLKGKVHGVEIELTMEMLSSIASFDSGIKAPGGTYEGLTDDEILCTGKNEETEWLNMLKELFDVSGGDYAHYKPLMRRDLKPLPFFISKVMFSNIMPRKGDYAEIRRYEIKVLYALVTGKVHISLRQLVMLNIWESRERKTRSFIPHCRLLTHMLVLKKVIPRNATPEIEDIIPLSRSKLVGTFDFEETSSKFILTDRMSKRVYEVKKNDEDIEDEEMGERELRTQVGESSVRREYVGQPRGYEKWTQFEKTLWDQHRADHKEVMKRIELLEENMLQVQRCHIYDRELYQQQFHEYTEQIRHDNNLQRGHGYQPVAIPFDYSRATAEHQINWPQYPGHPAPLHWPTNLGLRGGIQYLQNPHDVSEYAQRVWKTSFLHPR